MTQDTETQKPILGQILDSMFEALTQRDDFDAATIKELRQLAETGNLKKPQLVTKAITVALEATK